MIETLDLFADREKERGGGDIILLELVAKTVIQPTVTVVEMAQSVALPEKGFIKQEDIHLDSFLSTHNGRLYGGKRHSGKLT